MLLVEARFIINGHKFTLCKERRSIVLYYDNSGGKISRPESEKTEFVIACETFIGQQGCGESITQILDLMLQQ